MQREPLQLRDPLRELAVAGAFFGALALLAWREGVFEKLGDTALVVAAFATGFSILTAWLDRDLRHAVHRMLRRGAGEPRQPALSSTPAKSPAAKRAST
jgi:hypothetical protein